MKTSIVLAITRPYESDRLMNALTGSIIRPFTLWWVGIEAPVRDYRVEYKLDPDGEYIASKNVSMFAADFPVVLSTYESPPTKGIALCVLPVEWIGQRISRRVLPLEPIREAFMDAFPGTCFYCLLTTEEALRGVAHGPECVLREVRPLETATGGGISHVCE